MNKHPVLLPLSALVVGVVFGLGLILGGMSNPAKVIAFLDLAGAWDPSLALVMGGAIAVGVVAFAAAKQRGMSILGAAIQLPTARDIDLRLVLGSTAFGVGWGLAGFCPGPALVAVSIGGAKAALFVAAMLAGMGLFELISARRQNKKVGNMNTPEITTHSTDFSTSTQLAADDIAQLAQRGIRSVINNRPDREGGDEQPLSDALADAARQAGITYAYLPVVPSEISDAEVARFASLLTTLPKPVLAFCKTGGRSTKLYRLATQK